MASWTEHSLKVAMQSAFGTANTTDSNFHALLCDKPRVTFDTAIEELELLTGQVGAAPERVVGRRSGSIAFTIPLEGFKDGYDPTGENPGGAPVGSVEVIPPWLALVANAMGSNLSAVTTNADFWRGLHLSTSQYTAGGVSSATSTAITYDNATASDKIDVGQAVLTALSATSTVPQWGWAKTKAGQVVTLFEASINTVNDAAANAYGTATGYQSSEVSSTKPLTMRWVGDDTTFAYILRDCICESFKITWESGEVPKVEFTFKFYDFSMDKTKGGLVTPDAYDRIPQIVGSINGRATVAGTATCGLEACSFEWKATIRETKCHGTGSGISAVSIIKPRVTLQCTIPHDSGDTVYDSAGSAGNTGSHQWQSALELGTRKSFGVYVGAKVGRMFALLVPSGLIVATPAVQDRDGVVAYQLTVEAASYTADSTDTAETSADSPLDSIARVALG